MPARTGSSILGRQYFLEAGRHTATITEVGAGLQRYAVDGTEVTVAYPDDALPPRGCGATLVPWPNRIKDGRYTFDGVQQQLPLGEPEAGNAIHGLARWVRWAKVRHRDDALTLRCDIVPQRGYPFPLRVEVTYQLHADDGLHVTISARNTGPAPAPFGAGSHPYLSTYGHRVDDVTLELPARSIVEADDRGIPVGVHRVSGADDFRRGRRLRERRLDDGFTELVLRDGRGVAELRTRSGSTRLWFDAAFRYLQVFTLDSLEGGPAGIAIEPMSCAADAFNSGNGLVVLEPAERWSGSWGITPL
jgi:aldose 1-epimerase